MGTPSAAQELPVLMLASGRRKQKICAELVSQFERTWYALDTMADLKRAAGHGERDRAARRAGKSVACVACGKRYYPGLSADRVRPRVDGKLVPVSHADRAGYCSKKCERESTKK